MSLPRELLPLENVVLDLDVSSKKRLFEEVAEVFANNEQVDTDKVFQSLLSREKLGSTGLGCGVAIPHGRIPGLENAIAAFIRLKNPIDFEAQDEKPVSLLFVVLVPDESSTEHLKILSHLAQKFSDKEIRDQLKSLESPQDIVDVILKD
ncbi:PTS IIA-like nitrogen regulatory protein PtsN [Neisseriaceae bacterium PsAf]|nr:PTS IIA-like nitrogen regulatory protein PtsN [Neisseriaceae bacterium PsAf]